LSRETFVALSWETDLRGMHVVTPLLHLTTHAGPWTPSFGVGVGVPRVTGGGCRLGVSVNTSAGSSPQISAPADAGQYCVQVYDLGTLRDPVGFALKIDHP